MYAYYTYKNALQVLPRSIFPDLIYFEGLVANMEARLRIPEDSLGHLQQELM